RRPAALVVRDEHVDDATARSLEGRVLDLVDATVAETAALGADVRDARADPVAVAHRVSVAAVVDGLVLGDRVDLDVLRVRTEDGREIDVDVLVVRRPELELDSGR